MAVSKDKRAPDGDLHGKVALVTGAARRIGRAIALALAARGADVAVTYLTSSREAQDTVAEIQHLGVHSLALCCDVTDPKDVQATIKQVVKEFGGLDILVNNAAIYETVNFEDITPQQWDAVFATNVRGPFLVSQAALPALRKRKGRIVNLGSLGGIRPWATHAHYCSSKAALTMLTQVMAKALAPDIAVNCVAPGMIDMHEPKSAAFFRKTAAHTPMKRNGTAAEVAAAVAFFATAPQFITGQLLVVDGGLSLD